MSLFRDSQNLKHLDLSYMALGDRLYQICCAINESRSLLSVHLGDNHIREDILEQIILLFGIEKPQMGSSFTNGFGMLDSIEQMVQTNDLKTIVNTMYQESDPKVEVKEEMYRGYVGLPEILKKEVNSKLKEEKKQILQNAKDLNDNSQYTKLVISRKLNHPELIFNESNSGAHIDLENAHQKWKINFKDQDCYVC